MDAACWSHWMWSIPRNCPSTRNIAGPILVEVATAPRSRACRKATLWVWSMWNRSPTPGLIHAIPSLTSLKKNRCAKLRSFRPIGSNWLECNELRNKIGGKIYNCYNFSLIWDVSEFQFQSVFLIILDLPQLWRAPHESPRKAPCSVRDEIFTAKRHSSTV